MKPATITFFAMSMVQGDPIELEVVILCHNNERGDLVMRETIPQFDCWGLRNPDLESKALALRLSSPFASHRVR